MDYLDLIDKNNITGDFYEDYFINKENKENIKNEESEEK